MRKGARRKYWFFTGILGNRGPPPSDGVPEKTLVLGTHHIPDTPFRAWRARWRITMAAVVIISWLGVNYWKLKFYLRAKLECRVFGAVWPLIWWISGGFRPPVAVATVIRADSNLICLAAVRFDIISTLFCHSCGYSMLRNSASGP